MTKTSELTGLDLMIAVLVAYRVWHTTVEVGEKKRIAVRFSFVDGEGITASYKNAKGIFDMKTGDYVRLDNETVGVLCEEFNISVERRIVHTPEGGHWGPWQAHIHTYMVPVESENRLEAACRAFVHYRLGMEVDIQSYVGK